MFDKLQFVVGLERLMLKLVEANTALEGKPATKPKVYRTIRFGSNSNPNHANLLSKQPIMLRQLVR